MHTHLIRNIVLISVILLFAMGYILYTNNSSLVGVFAHSGPTPTVTPPFPLYALINSFQSQLEQVDDPEAHELIEQKLAIAVEMAATQAEGAKFVATRPANPYAVTTTPIIVGEKLTGIFYPSVAFPPAVFNLKNGWQEKINGNYILVVAGAFLKDPLQGVLLVEVNEGASHFRLRFSTPEKNGAVKIVSAKDNRLLLEAEDGSTIYFDVPSMSFTKSQDEVLPTITQRPAQTEIQSTQSLPYP